MASDARFHFAEGQRVIGLPKHRSGDHLEVDFLQRLRRRSVNIMDAEKPDLYLRLMPAQQSQRVNAIAGVKHRLLVAIASIGRWALALAKRAGILPASVRKHADGVSSADPAPIPSWLRHV
jgi:hypothetical protein